MKRGDLVYARDATANQILYEGIGILVRPDEGRTYVDWSDSWEVYFAGIQRIIVIDGTEIEMINEAW